MTPIKIIHFRDDLAAKVCSWVSDTETLALISSDRVDFLTHEILVEWIENAYEAYCMLVNEQLVGFATIGSKEWDFPKGICEIGHLIVKPENRRRYYGSIMLYGLLDMIRERGFDVAVGRIISGNFPAEKMLRKAGWMLVDETWSRGNFNWYEKDCKVQDSYGMEEIAASLR